jgi:hypothetical protein
MPDLPNGQRTKSKTKTIVKEVRLKGKNTDKYTPNGFVAVYDAKKTEVFKQKPMTHNTDITRLLDGADYTLQNESGGTIEYEWITKRG